MCGIVAVVDSGPTDLAAGISPMCAALTHRGPDESGSAVLDGGRAALAMRRLSVVDTEGGHQPMWDEERRHCIVFNGEIYNARELRSELMARGHRFATDHSDTEVLVHGFEEWGEDLPIRLDGMFAFAIWSEEEHRLFVARDRAGQKPLYLADLPGGFAVASELKALLAHPAFTAQLDHGALAEYLAYGYVLGGNAILEGVTKLPPGAVAWISEHGIKTRQYWTQHFADEPLAGAPAVKQFDELLSASVEARMIADVPVGLFLSGGLDSTAVGYHMRQHSDDVHSFSIAFDDPRFDESQHSSFAAKALGTRHHVQTFSEQDFLDLIHRIPEILDEPMGDPSIFPTFMLSDWARRHVTVALGGDGSDELLMGYEAYRALAFLARLDRVSVARALAVRTADLLSKHGWVPSRWSSGAAALARHGHQTPELRVLGLNAPFHGDASQLLTPDAKLRAGATAAAPDVTLSGKRSPGNRALAAYTRTFLSEDILVKLDRASMAASLEARSPFLSRDLLEFYGNLSPDMKRRAGTGKWILKTAMRGRIPDQIIDRPKQGFEVPLGDWLRGPLAGMVSDHLLAPGARVRDLVRPSIVDAEVIRQRGKEPFADQRVWLLLQLSLWCGHWGI